MVRRSLFGLGVLGVCALPSLSGCSSDDGGSTGPSVGGSNTGGTSFGGTSAGGSGGWPSGGAAGSGAAGSGGEAGMASGGAAGAAAGGSGGTSSGGTSSGGTGGGNTGGTGGGNTGGTSSGGTGGGNTGGTGGTSYPNPKCLASQAGAYCGNDMMSGADPNVLYQCPGANQSPTSSTPCPNGCVVEAQGTPDHCKTVTSPGGYRLPWPPGVSMQLTQDCKDSCCNDHVNDDQWAWDFANGGSFTVVAARGGTVTHLKINSTSGCGSSSCVNNANYIVIDHGDGTQSTYLHLQGNSLQAGVSCGATVQQGQALAKAGTTGWSTGIHLHFQVSAVHTGAATCECGSDGKGCAANSVPWANFWSSPTYPTKSIQFEEWPAAPNCADRRIAMPASQNN